MNLESAVPLHDGLQDRITATGFAAISAVPVIGGPAVELASGLLAERQARRQYDFNLFVARAVDRVIADVEGLTPTRVLESDEFMAAYERASRAAAESASREHRERLARVVAGMGDWSGVAVARRQQLFAIVTEITDLHIRVLTFLQNPTAFIAGVRPDWHPPVVGGLSVGSLIGEFVFGNEPGWDELNSNVLNYFTSNNLAENVSSGMMSPSGALRSFASPLGNELLDFISEPSPPAEGE